MKNLLLIILLSLSWGTTYAVNIANIDFSTDTTSVFGKAGDGNDFTLSWNSTEEALSIGGTNTAGGRGYAFIALGNIAVNPALNAEDITITYDLKLAEPLVGSAIHFLSDNPGTNIFTSFDLQNQGVNENTWTSFSHTISGITPGTTSVQTQFQLAVGADLGAGGTLLVDNIVISQVPEPSTYALIAGFAVFAFVAIRRKIK